MTKQVLYLIAILAVLGVIATLLASIMPDRDGSMLPAAPILAPNTPFTYSFAVDGVLHEAGNENETTSPYWWVNSGGKLLLTDGVGSTVQGKLDTFDRWRVRYSINNPRDTDDGYHPQNLFRLISRSVWQNPRSEAEFYIAAHNQSDSPNRNESNGILFMSRYQNEDTLYYAGVRVDGHAVIKKKYQGTYYTMAEVPIFPGTYDRASHPNLLPQNTWFALRMETTTVGEGVSITIFMRDGDSDAWIPLVTAIDDGNTYNGTPIIEERGRVGIRTDFMDVRFRSIRIEEIQ
jgi:hypothetical protein